MGVNMLPKLKKCKDKKQKGVYFYEIITDILEMEDNFILLCGYSIPYYRKILGFDFKHIVYRKINNAMIQEFEINI